MFDLRPSYQNGFARSAAESRWPSLWRGLVGAWHPGLGPTGGTLYDWSGYGNHGTLTNMDPATDWVVSGQGHVLDTVASSDQHASVGNPAILQLDNGPITIAIWGYDREGGNSIITKGESRGTTGNRDFDLFDTGSQFRFHGTRSSGVLWQVDTTTRPALNAWNFYAGTWDGTTVKLYINGTLANTGTATGAPNGGHVWHIGGTSSLSHCWNGLISSTAIYNRALHPREIQLLSLRPGIAYERRARTYGRAEDVAGGFKPYWARNQSRILGAGV